MDHEGQRLDALLSGIIIWPSDVVQNSINCCPVIYCALADYYCSRFLNGVVRAVEELIKGRDLQGILYLLINILRLIF